MQIINSQPLDKIIYTLRGQKVMIDKDLAELYGVTSKRLSEQVRRNLSRFPEDFMFECNYRDIEDLRPQIAATNQPTNWIHKRRVPVMAFTEHGVTMISSVLNSEQAIQINISIIRAFIELRKQSANSRLETQFNELKDDTTMMFKIVFQKLDAVEVLKPIKRKKIGLIESTKCKKVDAT